ncbi:DUF413 domain-containing protein [Pseudoalteromonas haloplanktis]|uniref:Macrodomain Ori protein n=1 Tax=Pseudoalteromonas haloplanktis TaxID=228 RepID=A0ABU1BAK0_PSEHA|nr:DUF413 domain-containing protein [Pseudoalteromonas haloplanktis]MDQ9091548.1 DUF413 domain-containing protein [Pseudoalteromonas haloplanktis]
MNIEVTLIIVVLVSIACIFLARRKEDKSDNRLADNCKSRENHSPKNYEKVSHSTEHRALINKPYSMQCKTEVFTLAELEIINKYGAWLSALASNQINPETNEQKIFVEECQRFRTLNLNEMLSYFSNRDDGGSIQSVWFKYLCRLKFEKENPSIVNEETKVDWSWQGPPVESGDHVFFSK